MGMYRFLKLFEEVAFLMDMLIGPFENVINFSHAKEILLH